MKPPELLPFDGDWVAYEEELHRIFIEEIAKGALRFRDLPIRCRRRPETEGRWALFWHLVQEGPVEDDRHPDLRRCERLRWIRWVIENSVSHPEIDEWRNMRDNKTNTLLWYREEYLVVLARRHGYWLLKTAYCTEKSGRIRRLQNERDAFHHAIGSRRPR